MKLTLIYFMRFDNLTKQIILDILIVLTVALYNNYFVILENGLIIF